MEGRKTESSHLNLRWDDHTLTFVHLLDHFRLQELYCDASLACAGGGVYAVHKVVLSACSDFFASIFASASCQNPVVVLQDVGREELEALLTYVYRGEVLLPRPALPAFLKVAGSLQVKGLSPPPLTPLTQEPRDAWGASNGVSPSPDPPDASHHSHQSFPPPPYPQTDPPPYTRLDMASPPDRYGSSWGEEGAPRSCAPHQQAPRMRGGTQGDVERKRPLRKRFSPHFAEQFGGTFQNLVASEEGCIKEEPLEEEVDLYDSDRLTICDKDEEDEEEMEEEQERDMKARLSEECGSAQEQGDDGKTEGEEAKAADEARMGSQGRRRGGGGREGGEEETRMAEVKIMLDTRQLTPTPPPTTSDGRDSTSTTTTTTTLPTSGTIPTSPHSKSHHHLLVTSQPTYRNRMDPPPPHAPHTPTHYPPALTPYKGTTLMDTDTPLNLSQDPHPHRNPYHYHSTSCSTRAEQVERRSRERDPFLGKILTNRKRRLRGPKSWEYLVRLLRDPTTNPALIRWENEAKGVFRLVQPAAIAQRWGRRTGKHASECLTYENFARGLRYHYATGALEPVSERSFVYKFGPKALLALDDGDYGVAPTVAAAAPAPAIATLTHL